MTTERDVFDKASSRGKRKLVWQHGKSSTNHQGKRTKKSTNEDQINASDMHWIDSDNATGNMFSDVKHSHQKRGPRLHNPSAHSLINFDSTSDQEHWNKYQSPSNRVPPHGNLRSNPQTSHNECNIYFAKATRDATPVNKNMPGEQASSSSSKWAKFMSSSSSSQDELHKTMTENNSPPYFVTPDMHHDNSRCNHKTILSSQHGSGSHDSQYSHNSLKTVPTSYTTIDDIQTKSRLGHDLFKVDDDLDGEWWDSL